MACCAPKKQKGKVPDPLISKPGDKNNTQSPPNGQKPRNPVKRFSIGDTVQCRTGPQNWGVGTVHALDIQDAELNKHNGWPASVTIPYQIQLKEPPFKMIYAPFDEDDIIRAVDPNIDLNKKRFAVGDNVECRMGAEEWAEGTVVALDVCDAELNERNKWAPGSTVPYRVELMSGRLIFAPWDDEDIIRGRLGRAPTSAPQAKPVSPSPKFEPVSSHSEMEPEPQSQYSDIEEPAGPISNIHTEESYSGEKPFGGASSWLGFCCQERGNPCNPTSAPPMPAYAPSSAHKPAGGANDGNLLKPKGAWLGPH